MGTGAGAHRWCAFGVVALSDEELDQGPRPVGRSPVRCHDCDVAWPASEPCTAPRRSGYPELVEVARPHHVVD